MMTDMKKEDLHVDHQQKEKDYDLEVHHIRELVEILIHLEEDHEVEREEIEVQKVSLLNKRCFIK